LRLLLFSPLPPRPFTPAGVKGSLNSRFGGGAPVTGFGSRGCGAGLGARIGRRCGRSGGLTHLLTTSPPTPLERAEQRRIGRIRAGACLRRQPSLRTTPSKPSSARYPAGVRSTARLFFGYFLLAKQKKVARPPGRNPENPGNPGQSTINIKINAHNTKDPK
jgi:hypothetical protein